MDSTGILDSSLASTSLNPSTRQWISKYVTKFLAIGRNMVRRNHWYQDYYPRCRVSIKTHSHLLQCPHHTNHTSKKVFTNSLQKLTDWIYSVQTPDSLITAICSLVTEWKLGTAIRSNSLYSQPINQQIHFGWTHFMEGRPLKIFSQYMQTHYELIESKRT